MSGWKEYKISELGTVVTGKTPSSKFPEEFGSDMPFITPSDYANFGKWADSAERSLSQSGIEKLRNKVLPSSSLLVTCIGSDMGKVVLNRVPTITNQQINSIVPDDRIVDSDFLYYKLVDSYETLRMMGQAGTAVPIVNKGDFENISLEFPEDTDEQKSIASILNSLDDKIDLLHRQNKTLEGLAASLFRQWFIGEENEDLAKTKIYELITFDPREKVNRNLEYSFYDMKCLSENDLSIAKGTKRKVNSGSAFRNQDTLLAKITPCLENGKTGFVFNLGESEIGRGSTEFIVLRAKENVSPYFVYCLARHSEFRNLAILSMTGTSGRQRVQTDILKSFEINFSEAVMNEFHEAVENYFLKIKSNSTQIQSLIQLRDSLLPKLMSGEITMKMN